MIKIRSILYLIILLGVQNTATGGVLEAALAAAEAELAAFEAAAAADTALADFKEKLAEQNLADAAVVAAQSALDAAIAANDSNAVATETSNLAAAQSAAENAAEAVAVASVASDAAALVAIEAATIAAEAVAVANAAYQALAARDAHEIDDSQDSAGLVIVNDEAKQDRTFHEQGDEDWVRLVVHEGRFYTIIVDQVGLATNPVLAVYGLDQQINDPIIIDDGGNGANEVYAFQGEGDGIFFIKLTNFEEDVFGSDITYSLSVIVENLSSTLAGPDLQVAQSTTYVNLNQGTMIDIEVDVTNLGGQLSDNTARNLSLNTYLANGISPSGELPDGCQFGDLTIDCDLEDLDVQQTTSFNFLMSAGSLGRRPIVSSIASYFDPERTSLQWDDRLSNNVNGIDFNIFERVNFGLNIRANKTSYVWGEPFEFYFKIDMNEDEQGLGRVDVYFYVELPDGSLIYIVDLLPEISVESIPLMSDWQPSILPDTQLLSFPMPGQIPIGEYTWSIVFVRAGGNIDLPADRLSSMSFVHDVQNQ